MASAIGHRRENEWNMSEGKAEFLEKLYWVIFRSKDVHILNCDDLVKFHFLKIYAFHDITY